MRLPRLALALLGIMLATRALGAELLVGAAISLKDALSEAGRAWTAGAPERPVVRFDFAATSTLVRQVEAHAPIDLIVSADEANMDQLASARMIEAGSRVDLLSNTLVLVVPASTPSAVSTPKDLSAPGVKHLALCDPAVPVGHYGHAVLEHLGLASALGAKIVRPDDARATLALVASGAAEAGFVYATDAATLPGKVRVVWTATAADGVDVRYPAAVVSGTKHDASVRAFLAWLQTEAARQIFRRFGFK